MVKIEYAKLRTPLTAQLELTTNCPQRCSYCYNSSRYNKESNKEENFTKDHFLKINDELIKADLFEIVYTGGEPLLRKDVLYDLIEKSQRNNIDTRINSNLILLKKDDAKRIKDLGIKSVLTSIISYDEKMHNKIAGGNFFKRTIKGIEDLLKEGVNVSANMVTLKNNKDHVYDTGKFLFKNFGIRTFCATPISPCSGEHKSLEINHNEVVVVLDSLLNLEKDFGVITDVLEPIPRCILSDVNKYRSFLRRDCSGGKITVAVSPNGDVRPCTHITKTYGNLRKNSLEEIWKEMDVYRDGALTPKKCRSCLEIDACSTGCRQAAHAHYDSFSAIDPMIKGFGPIRKVRKQKFIKRSLDKNQEFVISSEVRYREEGNNYIFFSPTKHSAIQVNSKFFNLIRSFGKEKFSIEKVIKDKSLTYDKLLDLFVFLDEKGVIEKYNN